MERLAWRMCALPCACAAATGICRHMRDNRITVLKKRTMRRGWVDWMKNISPIRFLQVGIWGLIWCDPKGRVRWYLYRCGGVTSTYANFIYGVQHPWPPHSCPYLRLPNEPCINRKCIRTYGKLGCIRSWVGESHQELGSPLSER